MQRPFAVILHPQAEGGYFVEAPSLPACYSQGETVEEALGNIREAIELVLEDLDAQGQSPPGSPGAGAPLVTEVVVNG
jgi:predicted RNase H-like HicB family nuclease